MRHRNVHYYYEQYIVTIMCNTQLQLSAFDPSKPPYYALWLRRSVTTGGQLWLSGSGVNGAVLKAAMARTVHNVPRLSKCAFHCRQLGEACAFFFYNELASTCTLCKADRCDRLDLVGGARNPNIIFFSRMTCELIIVVYSPGPESTLFSRSSVCLYIYIYIYPLCVCVCECVCVCVCEKERERECVCVCVREREWERERLPSSTMDQVHWSHRTQESFIILGLIMLLWRGLQFTIMGWIAD